MVLPVHVPRFSSVLLMVCLALTACRNDGSGSDLTSKVLFTANGTNDAQADARERLPGGLRRTTWVERPPLPGGRVSVVYDKDLRPLAWMLEVVQPGFTAAELAGPEAISVRLPTLTAKPSKGWRTPVTARLSAVLIVQQGDTLRIMTRGYATQVEPALLSAFK